MCRNYELCTRFERHLGFSNLAIYFFALFYVYKLRFHINKHQIQKMLVFYWIFFLQTMFNNVRTTTTTKPANAIKFIGNLIPFGVEEFIKNETKINNFIQRLDIKNIFSIIK
jgi:hypothetical protein